MALTESAEDTIATSSDMATAASTVMSLARPLRVSVTKMRKFPIRHGMMEIPSALILSLVTFIVPQYLPG